MGFKDILTNHQIRYPAMQAQDAYKLAHQAACGPAHAIVNSEDAQNWLEEEVQSLHNPYPEPAIDPISPDGCLVRVHLAPYLAAGGSIETFLDAFIATSHEFIANYTQLKTYLDSALPLFPGLESLGEALKTQGYPAAHHSEAYRTAYKPAYRVVLKHLI